jgi:hypothetical protein
MSTAHRDDVIPTPAKRSASDLGGIEVIFSDGVLYPRLNSGGEINMILVQRAMRPPSTQTKKGLEI